MNIKIAKIAIIRHKEIKTDETGRYCFRDDSAGDRCWIFGLAEPWCSVFDAIIAKDNEEHIRCQACIDAEKRAAALEGK